MSDEELKNLTYISKYVLKERFLKTSPSFTKNLIMFFLYVLKSIALQPMNYQSSQIYINSSRAKVAEGEFDNLKHRGPATDSKMNIKKAF